jgi:Flp pilus assembly protein TadG
MWRAISRTLGVVRAKAQKFGRDEVGTVVMYAAAIPVFAGVVAVGAETGNFYRLKRQMQNAADAAALSASLDNLAGQSTATIATDALYQAQRNGFANGVDNVSVTVNSPPLSGPNMSTPGAVEVIIKKSSQSFIFGNALNAFLGESSNPFTLTARSVAAKSSYTKSGQTTTTTTTNTSEGCIVALTPNAEQGISFTSFNNLAGDCSIMSNGTSTANNSNASIYMASFNNAKLTKGTGTSNAGIWARGSFYKTSYNSFSADSILTNQTTTLYDPYASLATPSPGTCSYTNYAPSGGTSLTLNPGTYCGGLTISSFNNVYFTPGTYYIANGDLYITSVNNVSCPTCTTSGSPILGVTFVLTQTTGNYSNIGGVKITSQNNVTLNAPGPGSGQPYPGVLFYQDRNAPAGTMTSTSKIFTVSSLNNATLSGAIYFPQNRIDLASFNNSSSSTNGCTIWIGRYIKFTSYNNNYAAGCQTFGTSLPGVQTTTTTTSTGPVTVTTSRVVE